MAPQDSEFFGAFNWAVIRLATYFPHPPPAPDSCLVQCLSSRGIAHGRPARRGLSAIVLEKVRWEMSSSGEQCYPRVMLSLGTATHRRTFRPLSQQF